MPDTFSYLKISSNKKLQQDTLDSQVFDGVAGFQKNSSNSRGGDSKKKKKKKKKKKMTTASLPSQRRAITLLVNRQFTALDKMLFQSESIDIFLIHP